MAGEKRARRGGTRSGGQTASGDGGPRSELMEERLFEVASKLFTERGFGATSLQDVADAMGVSRPALYYYVKSKEDILARLVEEFPLRDAERLRQIRERTDMSAAEKLREIVRIHVLHLTAAPGRLRMLDRNENHLSGKVAESHAKAKRAVLGEISGVIDEGIAGGEFRPVDARSAALGILGMCNWVSWWFEPDSGPRGEDVATTLAEMAQNSLTVAGEPNGARPRDLLGKMREEIDRLEAMLPRERPGGPG
jgi:AcrR family transcriptional regulator